MKIEHLAIWTSQLEPLRDFYVNHFGCSANAKYCNPATGFSSYFLTFPSGGARMELMSNPGVAEVAKGNPRCGYAHFALSLGSEERVRELTEKLRLGGVTVKGAPRRTGDGYYGSLIVDPDGNLIELTV